MEFRRSEHEKSHKSSCPEFSCLFLREKLMDSDFGSGIQREVSVLPLISGAVIWFLNS